MCYLPLVSAIYQISNTYHNYTTYRENYYYKYIIIHITIIYVNSFKS